jgi:hypothetical protein
LIALSTVLCPCLEIKEAGLCPAFSFSCVRFPQFRPDTYKPTSSTICAMRIMANFSALPIVVINLLLGDLAHAQDRSAALIAISAAPAEDWQVTYRLPRPATQLVFARSPDASRTTTWRSAEGFEILSTPSGEIVQRRDHAKFAEVSLHVPARYAHLPSDYAPFSPFGDGGILFHTGRLFACADSCSDDATWSMRLDAAGWDYILVDGRRERRTVNWVDEGDGRKVYLGAASEVETPDLLAIVDRALPASMRQQLERDLPSFMSYFSARLGSLPSKPTLFVSYDLSHPSKGYGTQGGVLAGQVFVHFYGAKLQEKLASPDFGRDVAWFLAHEAGHVYQRAIVAEKQAWWIHEGSAEAFAAIALRAGDASMAAFVESRIDKAGKECSASLQGKNLHEASLQSGEGAPYTCGMVLNLAIDAAVRKAGNADGLFAVWRNYIKRTKDGEAPSEAAYLAAVGEVSEVSNAGLADEVRSVVEVQGADLASVGRSESEAR